MKVRGAGRSAQTPLGLGGAQAGLMTFTKGGRWIPQVEGAGRG